MPETGKRTRNEFGFVLKQSQVINVDMRKVNNTIFTTEQKLLKKRTEI